MFEQYDDILTIEEVAELLRIGMTQAYRIVRSGNLKGYKEGKDWKIPKKALINYSLNDPKLLAVSVARQAIHFGSDYFTKQGLPVPFIATLNNELAQKMLSEWHVDMWSITRGMALATFINQLIAFIHRLFCDETSEMEQKLYEVRTRKILSYSNLIATSSNIAVVSITQNFQKLDVGGMAVTIYRLITDAKFIRQVKEEFT